MGKLRGQAFMILGVIMFGVTLLVAFYMLPAIGQAQYDSTANASLFPRNGLAYNIGSLGPGMYILAPIIGILAYFGYASAARQY